MPGEFDWDSHNEAHIALHKVLPREFEEVLRNGPVYIETRIDDESGEERVLEIGHTNSGRVLFVAWTYRGERTRPITAFDVNRTTRKAYEKKRYEENRH